MENIIVDVICRILNLDVGDCVKVGHRLFNSRT